MVGINLNIIGVLTRVNPSRILEVLKSSYDKEQLRKELHELLFHPLYAYSTSRGKLRRSVLDSLPKLAKPFDDERKTSITIEQFFRNCSEKEAVELSGISKTEAFDIIDDFLLKKEEGEEIEEELTRRAVVAVYLLN